MKNRLIVVIASLLVLFAVSLTLFKLHAKRKSPTYTDSITIRPAIKVLIDSIAKDGEVKGSAVGYAGSMPPQWLRFEKLQNKATQPELEALSNHQNPTVRCYAFWALVNLQSSKSFALVLKHLHDTSVVSTLFGCLGGRERTGDFFVSTFLANPVQKHIIDSILIFDTNIRLTARYRLLTDTIARPEWHDRVKQLVITENNEPATLMLARYHRKEDVKLIAHLFDVKDAGYYAAYSAREFPDSSFYPHLVKLFDQQWQQKLYDYPQWRILYQALARYPNPQTLALFEKTIKYGDSFRKQTLGKYLMIAITKYPNPAFEPLKKRIKLESYALDGVKTEMDTEQ